MDFKLEISRDNSTYYKVDLFPDSELNYDVDFYDNLEIDKIKLPFSSAIKIPLSDNNKLSTRFNYDPLTDPKSNYPKEDFYFKLTIFGSSNTIIEGILNVISIEYNSDEPYIDVQLNDFVSKYINELKDTQMWELYDANSGSYGTYYETNQTFSTFFDAVASGGERGTVNTNPSQRPIIFPYVDFVNDVNGKFGYAARQFSEYGVGLDRAGIVPVFNVKEFIYHIGLYLTGQGFSTRVDSKLFAQGYTEAIPEFEAEKLHFLIPAKLEADKDVNTRTFNLRQSPFWVGTNTDLFTDYKTSDPSVQKDFVTDFFFSNETFGNYGPSGEGGEQAVANSYGVDVTDAAYPEKELFGYERGYFAPHMSFEADIDFRAGVTATVPEVEFEIPVVNEDNMTRNIIVPDSTMTFDVFIGIYQDGALIKKIRVEDTSGSPIVLNADEATAVAGNTEKTDETATPQHFFVDTRVGAEPVILGISNYTDMLRWNLTDLEQDRWRIPDETITIQGESRYGVNYFLEPSDGTLSVQYTTDTLDRGSYTQATNPVTSDLDGTAIKKAITRIDTNYGSLDIKFTANANFNPYFSNDEYNIKDSLRNTCKTSVYEVLLALCKRFNCGLFYEYDPQAVKNVLRIDPLSYMRSGSQNVNEYIDDLRSAKVFIGGDRIKNISLINKDYNLFFDDEDGDGVTIGSTTKEINSEGISDLEVKFNSSVYYKSVCGDPTDTDQIQFNENYTNGVVSQREIAFTPNLFTPYTDVGIRFAYVDKPLYRTMIKRPLAISKFQRANLYTKTQRIYDDWTIHTFNGRMRHKNIQNWSLLAEEGGSVTDYYNFYTDDEKIKYSDSPSIEFDMVVPTTDLADLDFLLQNLTATLVTQETILVKEASGDVYEDYAYLTIKGILQ
jgi:hypothetical protein